MLGHPFLYFGHLSVGPNGKTRSETFKDQEDYVSRLLHDLDPGVLSLLYKTLYAAGFRIETVDMEIRKLKRRLAAPSS